MCARERKWEKGEKNTFKCVGSFCVCMFVFCRSGPSYEPPPTPPVAFTSRSGRRGSSVTVKPHPKQTPRCLCFTSDSRYLEFLFSKRRSLSPLTRIDLVRHVGVHPHLKLTQEGCLAETDTATWICTLTISSKVDYWPSQTCWCDLSLLPTPPPLPSFL